MKSIVRLEESSLRHSPQSVVCELVAQPVQIDVDSSSHERYLSCDELFVYLVIHSSIEPQGFSGKCAANSPAVKPAH